MGARYSLYSLYTVLTNALQAKADGAHAEGREESREEKERKEEWRRIVDRVRWCTVYGRLVYGLWLVWEWCTSGVWVVCGADMCLIDCHNYYLLLNPQECPLPAAKKSVGSSLKKSVGSSLQVAESKDSKELAALMSEVEDIRRKGGGGKGKGGSKGGSRGSKGSAGKGGKGKGSAGKGGTGKGGSSSGDGTIQQYNSQQYNTPTPTPTSLMPCSSIPSRHGIMPCSSLMPCSSIPSRHGIMPCSSIPSRPPASGFFKGARNPLIIAIEQDNIAALRRLVKDGVSGVDVTHTHHRTVLTMHCTHCTHCTHTPGEWGRRDGGAGQAGVHCTAPCG
jgi:hypothetical protein